MLTFYANIVFEGVREEDFLIFHTIFSHETTNFVLFNVVADE
jgi:hypothetical protein